MILTAKNIHQFDHMSNIQDCGCQWRKSLKISHRKTKKIIAEMKLNSDVNYLVKHLKEISIRRDGREIHDF